mgnify:CR=1 FL=1
MILPGVRYPNFSIAPMRAGSMPPIIAALSARVVALRTSSVVPLCRKFIATFVPSKADAPGGASRIAREDSHVLAVAAAPPSMSGGRHVVRVAQPFLIGAFQRELPLPLPLLLFGLPPRHFLLAGDAETFLLLAPPL